jgi:hypothetical protein
MYGNGCCEPWIWAAKDAEIVRLFGISLTTLKRYRHRNDERKDT